MDIGTLTGQIAIEDQLTDKLTTMASHVQKFAENFDGALGVAAIGVGVLIAAVGGAITSIVALGEKGSTIIGVQDAFDRLALAAGTTGDELRDNLNAGVKETISEFDLMQSTSRLMSSGFKMTSADALLLGQASRELGKATGTDARGGLDILSGALTTGRIRTLQQQIGIIDLSAAEKKYALSLGVTVDELSKEGKLHADQVAILAATQAYLERVGVSQLTFKERIQQAHEAITEWTNTLAVSVASSPHVMAALDAIGAAIQKSFGGAGQTALETIVGWVNKFADAVAHYGPSIIQTVADIFHGIVDVWHTVQQAWDSVPDWFKNIARDAGIAGGAVYLAKQAFDSVGGTDALGSIANMAQIWGTWGNTLVMFVPKAVAATAAQYALAVSSGTLAGSFAALLAPIALWTAAIAGAVAILYAAKVAWDLWDQSVQAGKDAAWNAAAAQRDLALASSIAGKKIIDQAEASKVLKDHILDLQGKTTAYDRNLRNLGVVVGTTIAEIDAQSASIDKNSASMLNSAIVVKKAADAHASNLAIDEAHQAEHWKNTAAMADFNGERELKKLEDLYKKEVAAHAANIQIDEALSQASWARRASDMDTRGLDELSKIDKHYKDVTQYSKASMQNVALESRAVYLEMAKHPEEFSKTTIQHFKKIADASQDAVNGTKSAWGQLKDVGKTVMGDLNNVFQSAFEGGGGIGGAIKSLATNMVKGLLNAIPLVGPFISQFAGAIVAGFSKLGHLFGIGESQGHKDLMAANDEIKKLQDSLITTYGSLDNIRQMGGAAGEALAAAWGDQNQAGLAHFKGLADEFNASLVTQKTAAQEAADAQKKDEADLAAAISKYKFSIEELGPAMQKQELHKQALELLNDWTLLVGSGIEVATVNAKMSSNLSDYLNLAIKTGQEVPREMEPMIKQFIKSGALFDANGKKITDMGQLGVHFSETMTQGFDRVVTRLEALITVLNGGVLPALDNMGVTGGGIFHKLDDSITNTTDAFHTLDDSLTQTTDHMVGSFETTTSKIVGMKDIIGAPITIEVTAHYNDTHMGGYLDFSRSRSNEKLEADQWTSEQFHNEVDRFLANNPGDLARAESALGVTDQQLRNEGYRFAQGGVVPNYYATGAFIPQGTDTVPAMLTPGERVLTVNQNMEYEKHGGSNSNVHDDEVHQEIRRLGDKLERWVRIQPTMNATAARDYAQIGARRG